MRKLLIIFVCALVSGLLAGSVSASYYNIDISPDTKTFANEVTVSPGSNITIDIYLSGIPEAQYAGGCWIDFSSSTGQISYVSAGRALSDGSESVTGPWTPTTGMLVNEPDGPGTLMMVVANLGGASLDGDGDLIVGRVTLNCTALGDATITISTIPRQPTWTPEEDANVENGHLTIHQILTTTAPTTSPTTLPTTAPTTAPTTSPTTSPTTTIEASTTTTMPPPPPTTSTSSSSSTTTTPGLCLFELIYGKQSDKTELLRYIRDNILNETLEGQEIIRLYYEWSPVIVKMVEDDNEFKAWLKGQVDGILPLIVGTGK